ncbi:MAG: RNA methyltransferase, partial [Rhodobacteraceae bacterium]|nr:RNA methyltransferase [Paracoccaceae bacterium]
VPDAVSDCAYVFATTARGRDLTKPIMTPERAMEHARALIASGQKVAVLFGPERTGLENPDIVRANAIISIPVNAEFPSLNLGQAVLLCAYEWMRQDSDRPAEVLELAGTELAPAIEVERLGDHFEERLEEAGFFFPATKAEGMKLNLRNLWSRMPLTRADVQTLHGALRQILRRRDG